MINLNLNQFKILLHMLQMSDFCHYLAAKIFKYRKLSIFCRYFFVQNLTIQNGVH
jgi:phosphatidylserine decarboxylase